MVLTHMLVKQELNPLAWFLGLPLAVAAGWVWLDALYGTPVAYLAIVAGVVDVLIGIGPAVKEGHWQARMVRKIEDGSARQKTNESEMIRLFEKLKKSLERFNKSLGDWWFRDVLRDHPNEIRTINLDDGLTLNYVGFPLLAKDYSIFAFTAKRLVKLDPRQCLIDEDRDRTNHGEPVPETFLVENVGQPQIRIEPKGINLNGSISSLFTPENLANSKFLTEGETSSQEVWIYKALHNANEYGITIEMRSLASKAFPLQDIINASPKKNMGEKQQAAMRFILSVGYKVVDNKKTTILAENGVVGLFNYYKAVGVVITRRGDNDPGVVDPMIEPVLIDSDELKALNDRAAQ